MQNLSLGKVILNGVLAGVFGGLFGLLVNLVLHGHPYMSGANSFRLITVVMLLPSVIMYITLARYVKSSGEPLLSWKNLIKTLIFAVFAWFTVGLAYALFFFIAFAVGLVH